MPDDPLTALKVQIAELAVELRNIAHDVKNSMMENKAMASLRELQQARDEFAYRMTAAEKATGDRLKPLEDIVKWGGRIIAGSVVLALLGLVLKTGAHP